MKDLEPVRPNFFIVGAPKCGTTAMHEYLKAHPDVFMPDMKEVHFFGSDIARNITDANAYLALFSEARNFKAVGEASVFYMTSKHAAAEMRCFSPEARIIIMLRNPVDMLYSYYYQVRLNGWEDIQTFGEALAAEPDRKRGRCVPEKARRARRPDALYYRDVARFPEQVERYYAEFGKQRVKVVLFDDLKSDTEGTYREVLSFLGVDDAFVPKFDVVNASKVVRYPTLKHVVEGRILAKKKLVKGLRLVLPRQTLKAIRKKVYWIYTQEKARPPMDPSLRTRLVREMAPEVEELGQLIGRDLSHWCSYS